MEDAINCDGTLRPYNNEGSAAESLETILSDVLPISWDLSDRAPTTNINSRRMLLALLEAFIVIDNKLRSIGRNINAAYPTTITLRPNSGKGLEGEVMWQTCGHRIDVGYLMNTESITHELGHEFDCQHQRHQGSNLLTQVNHFIYRRDDNFPHSVYRGDLEKTCNRGGRRTTLSLGDIEGDRRCISNRDVQLCVGEVFCFLSGNMASAPQFFQHVDEGFGARVARVASDQPLEVWADMFMNWVYTSRSQPYQVTAGFQHASHSGAATARYQWMTRKIQEIVVSNGS